MRTKTLLLSLTTLAAASLALAQATAPPAAPPAATEVKKQAPPAPGPAKPFTIPARKTFTLDNGLRVSLVPYGDVPKVAVELAVRAGWVDQKADQVWLADLTGDMIREGTKTKTASQISEAAAKMGGELNVNVGADTTEVGGEVLSEFAASYVALVADVAMNPSFPEADFARRKADRVRQLALAKTQPQPIAQERFLKALYRDHPYGRLFPTEAMIQGYTLDAVRGFHAANFGASRARLYVVGRFDEAAVEKAIRSAFSGWARGTAAAAPAPAPKSERAIHFVDRPGAVQSTLILGLPVTNPSQPDYIPMLVTNTLLGGYFSSRITSNIREQKGYTYSPVSQVSTRYKDAYWAEQADVTTAVTGASLKEIFAEIDRLQAEAPPASELKATQNYMSGIFVLQNSARGGIVNQLEFVDLQGLPDSYLRDFVGKVNAVTPEKVREMAGKMLDDGKMTIVVVGDRKAVEEQVQPYGKFVENAM
jgi:predicted Zn-dependent peptidase